jgi:hypothetical protein
MPQGRQTDNQHYFLNAEEERAARADVLLAYTETKRHLALLREQAHRHGEALRALADRLATKPEDIDLQGKRELLDYDALARLATDTRNAAIETNRLYHRVRELGLLDT